MRKQLIRATSEDANAMTVRPGWVEVMIPVVSTQALRVGRAGGVNNDGQLRQLFAAADLKQF